MSIKKFVSQLVTVILIAISAYFFLTKLKDELEDADDDMPFEATIKKLFDIKTKVNESTKVTEK